MAKVEAADIAGLGFTAAMFTVDDDVFATMLDTVVSEQASLLAARLGIYYDSADSGVQARVKRAEKCLCGAEMVQRRVNVLLGNAVGAGAELDTRNEQRQQDNYRKEAEALISLIAAGASTDGADIASGVLTTGPYVDPYP